MCWHFICQMKLFTMYWAFPDNNSIITIVSVFILGLTLVLSYISIGTKIENSAGEITSLIIVLTTLSNLSILVIPDLKIYFLLVLIPVIFVILYLFENNRLRKIFFLNIMTIIIIVKVVPLLLPQILPTIIEYIFKWWPVRGHQGCFQVILTLLRMSNNLKIRNKKYIILQFEIILDYIKKEINDCTYLDFTKLPNDR